MTVEGSADGSFIVDLGSLELPREVMDQIARAIQKAVLAEIASLDIAPRFGAELSRPRGLLGPGPTDGIWLNRLPES
jgi:hypothetical protein